MDLLINRILNQAHTRHAEKARPIPWIKDKSDRIAHGGQVLAQFGIAPIVVVNAADSVVIARALLRVQIAKSRIEALSEFRAISTNVDL